MLESDERPKRANNAILARRTAMFAEGASTRLRWAPSRLGLLAASSGQCRPDPEQRKLLFEALTAMIRDGWGSPNPVFRHFFTSTFVPDASPSVAASFDELQRIATGPENALRIWHMNAEVDATALAKQVRVPTLVLHCPGDRVAPFEEGHLMAKLIPAAHFVELPGSNHVLLEGTPAFTQFFDEAAAFLDAHNR